MSEKRYPKDVDALTGAVSTSDPRLTPPVLLPQDGEPGELGPPGSPGRDGASGAAGAAGAQGPPGVPLFLLGEQGEEGDVGPAGRDGAAGAAGGTGARGAQGDPGVPIFLVGEGEDGDAGPPGATGQQGAAGAAGATGAQGVPGVPLFMLGEGEDGDQGPPGPTGPQGTAGATGFGTPGAQGVPGVPVFLLGEQGDEGDVGPQGSIGPQGPIGTTGGQGNNGAQGVPGVAIFLIGEPGEDATMPGPPGNDGAQGKIGSQGPTGPAGPALFILDQDGDIEQSVSADTSSSAAATGSGRKVRETAPTIITPAIDTIISARPTWQQSGDGYTRDIVTYQRRSVREWLKNPAQTGHTSVGMIGAPTITSAAGAASGDTINRPMLTIATGAVANGVAEVITPSMNFIRRCWSPTLVFPFLIPNPATNVRIWIGIFNASLAALAANPTTQHVAALRYDTGLDGTAFWRSVTCDGATANVNTTTAAVVAAAESVYRFEMEGAVVNFYIDDVLIAQHVANLPGNTTFCGFGATVVTLVATNLQPRTGTFTLLHT